MTSKVYVDTPSLPPHPGPDWTRFVCISDNHSNISFQLPLGDVLLHAGDLSSWGYPCQLRTTMDWLAELDYPVKIVIAGNHDLCLDNSEVALSLNEDPENLREIREYMRGEMKDANVHYLEYESFEFTTAAGKTWKVYGSPAAPRYARGAFQYEDAEEAKAIYDKIPLDTEILLTHTPPHGCLDLTKRMKRAGCPVLQTKLAELRDCRLHVFGHIHECAGGEMRGEIVSVNAAVALSGQAVVVDLAN